MTGEGEGKEGTPLTRFFASAPTRLETLATQAKLSLILAFLDGNMRVV